MPITDTNSADDRAHIIRAAVVLTLVWAALFAMRLAGPVDLVSRDQGLSLAYMVDIIENGHWLVPVDHLGDPASKPPLHSWLGAASVVLFGRTWFAAALPSALAVLATTLWLLAWGARRFSPRPGILAASIFLLCHLTVALIPVVRSDPLLVLFVALASSFAFDAWRGQGSWWPFWICATLATLTKGPIGLVLPAAGLLAQFWVGSDSDRPAKGPPWWPGGAFFLVVTGGWFVLGWVSLGSAFVDEVLGQELIGHALRNDQGRTLLTTFWQPTAYLLVRFLPWSPLLVPTFARVLRSPASATETRALERFLAVSIVAGLVVLSLAGHKRGDLVAPLLPAAALLCGRELAIRTASWPKRRSLLSAAVFGAVLMTIFGFYHHRFRASQRVVRYSNAHHVFATALTERVGDPNRLEFTSSWFHVQYRLGVFHRPVAAREVVQRLAGEEPVWVVASPVDDVARPASRRGLEVFRLAEGEGDIAVISNRDFLP